MALQVRVLLPEPKILDMYTQAVYIEQDNNGVILTRNKGFMNMEAEMQVTIKTAMSDEFFSYGLTTKPHTMLVGVVAEAEDDLCQFGEVCDSQLAFLTDEQLAEWMEVQREIFQNPEIDQYIDEWSGTFVFDVDGQNFVVVSDCGGELSVYDFEAFCEERGISVTFVIDGLRQDPGTDPEDIYTGGGDADPVMLQALCDLYN